MFIPCEHIVEDLLDQSLLSEGDDVWGGDGLRQLSYLRLNLVPPTSD